MAEDNKSDKELLNLLRQQLQIREEALSISQRYLQDTEKSIEIQAQMNKGLKGVLGTLKKISDLEDHIKKLKKQAAVATATERVEIDKKIKSLEELKDLYEENYKVVNKTGVALKEMGKSVAQIASKLPDIVQKGFGKLKGYGIFEMDKAIKTSALSMGLLGKRSEEYYQNIRGAQNAAIALGVNIKDLAEMQAAYSDELGRSVLFSEQNLKSISAIAKGTGMGTEAAAKFTAELDAQGVSVKKTAEFVEQTMNDASSMGLNSSKVIKNIQNNIKLLNRYNFKGGVKGLAKMAESVTKLGMEMEDIAPMADKLWNIEGAVDMSAQLQVLGGRWSQLADPFKLMYMARNDMDGLVKSIGEAAAASASLDKDGNIQLATVQMATLRQVSEATGVSYEKLAEAAKRAGKAAIIKSKFSMAGLKDEDKEFLANVSEFENGRAFIEVGGKREFLDALSTNTKELIKAKREEQATLEKRAKDAQDFDTQLKIAGDLFKQALLPLAKTLAEKAAPAINRLINWFETEKIGDKMEKLGKWIAEKIGGLLDWVTKNPYTAIASYFGLKLLGTAAQWISNGYLLAKGFNLGTGAGGGGGLGGLLKKITGIGGRGAGAGGAAGEVGGAGGAGGAAGGAGGALSRVGSTIKGVGGRALIAATVKDQLDFFMSKSARSTGASGWLESLGGSGMSLLDWIPGVNQLVEATGLSIDNMGTDNVALARAVYRKLHPDAPTVIPNKDLIRDIRKNPDKYPDTVVEDIEDVKINDGIIRFNPKDKFMKIGDGAMIAGTNENGNQSLAKALMTTMTPSAQPSSSIPGSIKLSDLNVTGTIELKLNGDYTKEIGKELLKNPFFIKDISKLVHMATASAVSGRYPQNISTI